MDSVKPRHLVVAYPKLAKPDFDWIQSIRREQDELSYRAILPHFTFILRGALLMPPVDGGEYSYVFLVPDEGFSQIVRLHDLIYSGDLKKAHRFDIPFVPHLTLASSRDLVHCKELSDEINKIRPQISGEINELAVVVEDGDKISTVERIQLGGTRL